MYVYTNVGLHVLFNTKIIGCVTTRATVGLYAETCFGT